MNKNIQIDKYKKLKRKIVSNIIYILISFSMVFFIMYDGYTSRQESLLSYKSNEKFTCRDKSKVTIEINKADGWKYIDGYFINNNSSIEAKLCEALKEKK